MHTGSRRVVMSILQNYMLRNSIDRALLQTQTLPVNFANNLSKGAFRQQERSIFTATAYANGQTSSNSSQNATEISSSRSGPPSQAQLDEEAWNKLNQLKEGLQTKNEYFQKYKDKFQKLETTAPRELLAKLEQLDDQKQDHLKRLKTAEKISKKPRSLNDVMRVDSLVNLDRQDVVNLWQEFHRHKEGLLGAVMSGVVYDKMKTLASVHKLFVMPLPRQDGYEFFFMQFDDNTFHFTPLILYQTHQESAPVAVRLINYTDLKSGKDLVLLRGEYDPKCMKAEDAHFLAVQTNFYYGETNESRLALLEKFSKEPHLFDHMSLIDELKRIQETHAQLFEFEPTEKSGSS
ncbi:unnamed protein product [Orchesella dallaii]|uniref:ATP synthase mitochondrial F1 complex assembly factor 1 n=1 Tax=Orchesella dallaii TaxID=48710 RepID=A0ABP1RRI3_9HEXA